MTRDEKIVRTGWGSITETMAGLYISLEGDTAEDTEPLLFETRADAEAERAQYIDACLEAYSMDSGLEPEELAEFMECQRESLEYEEHVLFVGVDAAGDVFELDEVTHEIRGPIRRPDR